ncbi:MAG: hypothetical protein [Arizlama microvirus]|nr:MAG: hypothetical protein [Arizlama microvirus]
MFNRILRIVSTVLFVIRQLTKTERKSKNETPETIERQIKENVL